MAIRYTVADGVATIEIDRPEVLNALDIPSQIDLRRQLARARDDDSVRVIQLTGVGDRAFCVGSDLRSTASSEHRYAEAWTAEEQTAIARGAYVRALNLEALAIWKPMIAVINGHCIGGGLELALQCDIRVASQSATFALPEVKVGSVAGICGPLLLRVIPTAHAMKLLLTGARIDAHEALRIGLVSDVWPPDLVRERALDIARQVAANAPLSVTATKRLARETEVLPRAALMNMTEMVFASVKETEDRAEGRLAFAEKRQPHFVGR